MSETEFLGDRTAITQRFRDLVRVQPNGAPVLIVVAFWGEGVEALFEKGKAYKVVCNLSLGGTNPAIIDRLLSADDFQVEIKHLPTLHAKVVVASQGAIVSSANFSTNGLDLDSGTDGWMEAGVFVPNTTSAFVEVNRWAWDVWLSAQDVTADVLRQAYEKYQRTGQGAGSKGAGRQTASQDAPDLPSDLGLTEALLFCTEAKQNPKSALRGCSDALWTSYCRYLDKTPGGKERWTPVYVANLLWTHAGNSMAWREGTFQRPQQVVRRWREMKISDEQVLEFLVWLGTQESIPLVIQAASKHLHDQGWKHYTGK